MTTVFDKDSKWLQVKMEIGNNTCEQNARFAFLLGSALRNEDPEQFIKVYDSVLPKDTTPEQIEELKKQARVIADLPEEEFSELVVDARDFSLAHSATSIDDMPRPTSDVLRTSVNSGSISAQSTASSDLKNMELDEEELTKKPWFEGLGRTSGCEEDGDDSGVFNSSKITVSSVSQSDNDFTDDSDRPGMFHYFNPQPAIKKSPLLSTSSTSCSSSSSTSMHKNESGTSKTRLANYKADSVHIDMDISSEMESGTLSHDTDTAKVRFDQELHHQSSKHDIEMNLIKYEEEEISTAPVYNAERLRHFVKEEKNDLTRKTNEKQYDEVHNCDDSDDNTSDDMLQSVECHKRIDAGNGTHFARMHTEYEDEDYSFRPGPLSVYGAGKITRHDKNKGESKLILHSPGGYSVPQYGSISNDVDKGVNFTSLETAGYYSRNKEQKSVRVEEKLTSTDHLGCRPTYHKVATYSNDQGLFSSKQSGDVSGMPKGIPIYNNRDSKSSSSGEDEKREKRKKKKKSKDDSTEDDQKDENGNPINTSSSLSSRRLYSQREGYSSMNDLSRAKPEMNSDTKVSRKMKRQIKENEKVIKAKNIPGNIGNKGLDELLSFINNTPKSGPQSTANNGNAPSKKLNVKERDLPSQQKDKDSSKEMKDNHQKNELYEISGQPSPVQTAVVTVNEKPIPELNTKRKKGKNKSGSREEKVYNEADDRSSRTSEREDKFRDTFSEGSVSSEVPNTVTSPGPSSTNNLPLDVHNLPGDMYYIFTDFDMVPQKEPEFQAVTGKKSKGKKKQGDSGRDVYNNIHMRESKTFPPSEITTCGDNNFSLPRRSRQPTRSFTPPPTPTLSSNSQEYTACSSERALSPSAFPVLPNTREGRRNSTGNVPSELINDDSDIESVKSVPLVSSVSTAPVSGFQSVLAARDSNGKMSYAAMAAGRQNKGENETLVEAIIGLGGSDSGLGKSNSSSASSVAGNGAGRSAIECSTDSHLESTTSALAVDSSSWPVPEIVKIHRNQPVCSPSLPMDISATDHANQENHKLNHVSGTFDCEATCAKVESQSSPSLCEQVAITAASRNGCETSSLSISNNQLPNQVSSEGKTIPIANSKSLSTNIGASGEDTTGKQLLAAIKNPARSSSVKGDAVQDISSKPSTPAISEIKLPASCSHSATPAGSVLEQPVEETDNTCRLSKALNTKPPPADGGKVNVQKSATPNITPNNKRYSKGLKSVIFMDHKMNQVPPNLGISFGYFETDSSDSNKCVEMSSVEVDNTSVSNVNNLQVCDTSKEKCSCTKTDKMQSSVLHSKDCCDCIVTAPLSPSSKAIDLSLSATYASSPNSNDKCLPVKVASPINGLIIPASIPPPSPTEENCTGQCHTDSGVNSPSELLEHLWPEKDPNFELGCFNHEAVISYIYNEWQLLQNVKENGTSAVQYYVD